MAYMFDTSISELNSRIRSEVEFRETIQTPQRGKLARRVQEWLNLSGFGIAIDDDYGPITRSAVKDFQNDRGFTVSGVVNEITWNALTAPMHSVLKKPSDLPQKLNDAVVQIAESHLAVHPLEIGGQNKGPWVRMYMNGNEGNDWPWCAGFVSFVLKQACEALNISKPIPGSFSCDSLAAQAKKNGIFVQQPENPIAEIRPGAIFLNRRTSTDWIHTGIVTSVTGTLFKTIEGNTNDEGSREGYEVCERRRGFSKKDFVSL